MNFTHISPPTMINWYHIHLKICRQILILLLFTMSFGSLFAQTNEFEDEVLITLNVSRIGTFEIPAIIQDQDIFLPIKELFDLLRIKSSSAADFDSVSGYILNPKANFLIDRNNLKISYQEKIFDLQQTDLLYRETDLYLKSGYFGLIFGLPCEFDFRRLAILLKPTMELPYIRELEQERMRKNLANIKNEKKADTIIKKKFFWFQAGVADWSVTTIQEKQNNNSRVNLNLGGTIAGGAVNLVLNYNSKQSFDLSQQILQWRYVNNDYSALRQLTVGRIFTPTISSVFVPINGVQVTNTATTSKRSFGTYRISNRTEPGWMVELYINNVLISYTKADASGLYTFEVPLVYGSSIVKLRISGPYGEEQIKEEQVRVPFNFLPVNKLEYTVSAGLLADGEKSRFYRTNFHYGLSRQITIGTGVEYLSSVANGKPLPYINMSARLGSALLVSGEHAYGVKSGGTMNYRLPAGMQLELNYTKYDNSQTSVKLNYLVERKASVSMPFHTKKLSAFARLTYNESKAENSTYKNLAFQASSIAYGIVSNMETAILYNDHATASVYSNLSFSFRVTGGIKLRPQLQYEYLQRNFSRIKGELETMLFKQAVMNISYERNMISGSGLATLGARYNFSFLQSSFSARQSKQGITLMQSLRGSMIYNGKEHFIGLTNRSNVGKAGLIILPFLDLNCDGVKNNNEPKVAGLKLRVNGGRVLNHLNDTSIHITGLEPFTNYFIELNKNSFENISWQIRKSTISIAIEPSQLRIIEIPVVVVGEASGTVYLKGNKNRAGIGRVFVNFYNSQAELVGQTLTEDDGYFSFLGFLPGNYTARLDTAQLTTLKLTSKPDNISFKIRNSEDGVVLDGYNFELSSVSEKVDKQNSEVNKINVSTNKRMQLANHYALPNTIMPNVAAHPVFTEKHLHQTPKQKVSFQLEKSALVSSEKKTTEEIKNQQHELLRQLDQILLEMEQIIFEQELFIRRQGLKGQSKNGFRNTNSFKENHQLFLRKNKAFQRKLQELSRLGTK